MPINQIEQHPFLAQGENIEGNRMVVGTFPIFSLTNPRTPRKNQLQLQGGHISFFYGSNANLFWAWYQQFIDPTVNILSPQSIVESLQANDIAISDVISQCSRIKESFNDSDLRQKIWNRSLAEIIEERIDKIICTSKSQSGAMGWLISRLLAKAGFTIDQQASNALHENILTAIPGSNLAVKNVAYVLKKGNKKVSIVALPSPGSPQRRLVDFGYVNGVHLTNTYLQNYLTSVFGWF